MKALVLVLISLSMCVPVRGDTFVLGTFDLAGFPPESLPATDSPLRLNTATCGEHSSIALWSGETVMGHVPARHRTAIQEMLARGVQLQFRVVKQHLPAAPGRYLEVEVRANSPDIRLLIPLLEAESTEEDSLDEEWDG